MAEEDKDKIAFSCAQGHFEFNVMPFKLINSPPMFQQGMDLILSGLKWQCLVYLDDIVIYSSRFNEHLQDMKQVFDRIQAINMCFKLIKC